MKRKETFILITLLCALTSVHASLWNQLITLIGQIQLDDIDTRSSNNRFYHKNYKLSILSDRNFQFQIEANDSDNNKVIIGEALFKPDISLNSKTYVLKSTPSNKLKGQVIYQTGWGVSWKYSLNLPEFGLTIRGSQINYAYLSIVLLIFFGAAGVLVFSISDRARVKILFDLRKRTHPWALMIVILKALLVVSCFLIIGYGSIVALSIWAMAILYGVYLFSLSPSIIHVLYFVSAAQRGFSQLQWYKTRPSLHQFIIFFGSLLVLAFTFFLSFFFEKGIIFLYIISLNTAFIYAYCYKTKKFAFGPLIIYDAFLTLILSTIMLYLPVANFLLISYKQVVLFWNYYLFLFAFGMIFMKRLIKNEIVEEIQLSEYSTRQQNMPQSQSQRRGGQIKAPQSAQMIEG